MLREAREARVNTPPSQMQQEESRFDENLMTMELKGFVDMLEKKGKDVKVQELQTERLKVCNMVDTVQASYSARADSAAPPCV